MNSFHWFVTGPHHRPETAGGHVRVRQHAHLQQRELTRNRVQVLVGDPKQLEATSEFFNTHIYNDRGGLREQLLWHSRSAMQRLTELWPHMDGNDGKGRVCRLRTQYRMHDTICHLVDGQFYSGGEVRRRLSARVSAVRCAVWLPMHDAICHMVDGQFYSGGEVR